MPLRMSSYDFSAQRLFVASELASGSDVTCTRDQANYLLNVLRLKEGDEILLFNGIDGEWRAVLSEVSKRHCVLTAKTQMRPQTPKYDLHYLFAPLKRARIDYMVQKATEMGACHLQPVFTHRTQNSRVNVGRLQANAVEAAEQCGILFVPSIGEPMKLEKLIDSWKDDRRLIYCDEDAPIGSPIEALSGLEPGPLAVLVGPEGGFSEEERQRLSSQPYVSRLSLGPRIMRADTAGVAALAIVNSVLGDWAA